MEAFTCTHTHLLFIFSTTQQVPTPYLHHLASSFHQGHLVILVQIMRILFSCQIVFESIVGNDEGGYVAVDGISIKGKSDNNHLVG